MSAGALVQQAGWSGIEKGLAALLAELRGLCARKAARQACRAKPPMRQHSHTGWVCLTPACLHGGGCPVAYQPACWESMRCSTPQKTQVRLLMSHLEHTRSEHQPT